MKIALIHPPVPCLTDRRISPPLGILYLAAYIRRHLGIDPMVVDQSLNDDISVSRCAEQALEINADIYGISFGSTQYPHAVAMCGAIRAARPQALLVLGGPHATALPVSTLADTGADILVESEGEQTMLEIVMHAISGRKDYSGIAGIYLRSEGDGVARTAPRTFIRNLDSIPYPARDLVPLHAYTRTIGGKPATTIITSRGCPGQCIFCSQAVWKRKVRLRSVSNIIGEIDQIREGFGINNFLFLDDTLTISRKRILALCAELKKREVVWRGWTRANHVDQELLDTMAEANCMALCIGVESGSQRILNGLKKGTCVSDNRRAIELIKRSGMYSRISLIVGSPGETWGSIKETVDFVLECRPDDWILSTFVPVPGSEAFNSPAKFGIRIHGGISADRFKNFFVIGGEMQSGRVIEYDELDSGTMSSMRDYVYSTLMEKCPPQLQTFKGIQ